MKKQNAAKLIRKRIIKFLDSKDWDRIDKLVRYIRNRETEAYDKGYEDGAVMGSNIANFVRDNPIELVEAKEPEFNENDDEYPRTEWGRKFVESFIGRRE